MTSVFKELITQCRASGKDADTQHIARNDYIM